jgi:hypothetical protein
MRGAEMFRGSLSASRRLPGPHPERGLVGVPSSTRRSVNVSSAKGILRLGEACRSLSAGWLVLGHVVAGDVVL